MTPLPRLSRWSRLKAGLLTLVLLVAAVLPPKLAQADPPLKIHRILMVLWRGEEEAVQGFRDYFTAERIPVAIMIRDAAGDLSKLPGLVNEAKTLRPDLVVTWGTSVTLAVLGSHDAADPTPYLPAAGIPGVFMIVSQPVEAGIVPSLNSSGRNKNLSFNFKTLLNSNFSDLLIEYEPTKSSLAYQDQKQSYKCSFDF